MSGHLRGVQFETRRGGRYYYDDRSGIVFPCPEPLAESLRTLDEEGAARLLNTPVRELGPWEQFILERHLAYGAFFGDDPARLPVEGKATARKIESIVGRFGFRQLILMVNSACNLACRYCINSGTYPYAGHLADADMTPDTAIRAVDLYLEGLEEVRGRNPGRRGAISFYGGEPLLNAKVIRAVVEHVRQRAVPGILFTITTNGTLLKDAIADFLVENEFAIWVSLDGPAAEHDRNRVARSGKGSFDCILRRLERFWQRHPDYVLLNFAVTYDWGTDLKALRKFFSSREEFRRALVVFTQVKSSFTHYYERFDAAQFERFRSELDELSRALAEHDGSRDPVIDSLIGNPLRLFMMRAILQPGRSEVLPHTGTCVPGDKLAVQADGKLQPCERVPGLTALGDVWNGIDYDAAAALVKRYNEGLGSRCTRCNVRGLCPFCYSTFWSGDGFREPREGFCADQPEAVGRVMSETFSLLEEAPHKYGLMMKFFQQRNPELLSLFS
jgi:uncharacterized protein